MQAYRTPEADRSPEKETLSLCSTLISAGMYDCCYQELVLFLNEKKREMVSTNWMSTFLLSFVLAVLDGLDSCGIAMTINEKCAFIYEYAHEPIISYHTLEEKSKAFLLRVESRYGVQRAPRGTHQIVDAIAAYVREHISENISRGQIAKHIGYHEDYISHIFMHVTGRSLIEFIQSEKMKIAMSLLSGSSMSISTIASHLGYTNYSYFSQVFKKVTGMGAREYRQRNARDMSFIE